MSTFKISVDPRCETVLEFVNRPNSLIPLIKAIRAITGCDLKTAKEAAEYTLQHKLGYFSTSKSPEEIKSIMMAEGFLLHVDNTEYIEIHLSRVVGKNPINLNVRAPLNKMAQIVDAYIEYVKKLTPILS